MVPLTAGLSKIFKSIIDQDTSPVIVCNLMHVVVYMSPAAIKTYKEDGGAEILGTSIFDCHNGRTNEMIRSEQG